MKIFAAWEKDEDEGNRCELMAVVRRIHGEVCCRLLSKAGNNRCQVLVSPFFREVDGKVKVQVQVVGGCCEGQVRRRATRASLLFPVSATWEPCVRKERLP